MSASILNQGETFIRDTIKAGITHVCISDDTTAFVATHTGINPGAGTTSTHAKAATKTDVDFQTEDYSFTIDGTTFFTGKVINCIGVAKGTAVRQATGSGGTHTIDPSGATTVGTDTITRTLRSAGLGIGVQSGDIFTLSIRAVHQDNS